MRVTQTGYGNRVCRPSAAQLGFIRDRDATRCARSASAFHEAIFVYREEALGTWRWLIDADATIFEEDFFATACGPRDRHEGAAQGLLREPPPQLRIEARWSEVGLIG